MLHCADGSYYVGSATGDDLSIRIAQHQSGSYPGYTFSRRPVHLVWSEHFDRITDAIAVERQIKGWSSRKEGSAHQRPLEHNSTTFEAPCGATRSGSESVILKCPRRRASKTRVNALVARASNDGVPSPFEARLRRAPQGDGFDNLRSEQAADARSTSPHRHPEARAAQRRASKDAAAGCQCRARNGPSPFEARLRRAPQGDGFEARLRRAPQGDVVRLVVT